MILSDTGLVRRLLDDRSYHIEFNGHLTNHAKHAVVALAGLGAPAARIRDYYESYATLTPYGFGLEPPRPSRQVITDANWLDFLGRRTSFSAYCDFFDRRERELGLDELLRRYVPPLLPGWVGAFTHATIHLGWGLAAGSRWMAIEGLAYLAFSYVSCHPERSIVDTTSGAAGEGAMDSLLRFTAGWASDGGEFRRWVETTTDPTSAGAAVHPELVRSGLQFRIAALLAAGHPSIYRVPAWIADQDPEVSWEQLYYLVTLLYLGAPGDFVLLHLITSLYAMEQIADRLPPTRRRDALTYFWLGMFPILVNDARLPDGARLAALHATYAEATDADESWAEIIDRAVEDEEEHNPKLVYVLRQVWERTGRRSVYRVAAAQFTTTPELPGSFDEPPIE